MARGPATFKQRDLTRAIKAAHAAGVIVERAWIERDGKIALGFANSSGDRGSGTGEQKVELVDTDVEDTWKDVA